MRVEGAWERKRLLGKRWESHSAVLPPFTLTATLNPVYFHASASEHWGVRSLGGALFRDEEI